MIEMKNKKYEQINFSHLFQPKNNRKLLEATGKKKASKESTKKERKETKFSKISNFL
jgi:hypothetical protein